MEEPTASTSAGPLPLESRSLLVLHSTVTGTSIDTAERIARRGRREGWQVQVKGVAEFNHADLPLIPLVVFVVPTTGNGAAPPSFVPFWTTLLHPQLPSDILEDLRFAVFGLGDSSYAKYNWVAKKLARRLEGLGATPVVERGEGDDQNEWGIESTFPKWLDTFYSAINPLFPPSPDFVKLSPEEAPPPRIRMEAVPGAQVPDKVKGKDREWAPDVRLATVKEIKRVTPEDWFQDVRSLKFELPEGVEYAAGDVLEMRPQNSEEDVTAFLASIGWTDIADQVFSITPTSPDQPLPPHLPTPYLTTLRDLLTHSLDIMSIPRVSFFEYLSFFTSDPDKREKLRFFTTGEGQDDLNDYTLRPRRTIMEVMYEFRDAQVPKEYVLDLLPVMRQRGFSIAMTDQDERTVELLVAIVKYKTILSVPRKGVCTSYIFTLKPGDQLPVRFERGMLRLPAGNPPLIMIGPGTGVAPFRALMQERVEAGARENLLFFGCRSVKMDYYFKNEWGQMVEDGYLTLSVAASRDQEDKIYVQHRVLEHADLIWSYLETGGHIHICGSSTNMPKAVKKSFLTILAAHGLEGDAGEQFWEKLDKTGRLVEETWG